MNIIEAMAEAILERESPGGWLRLAQWHRNMAAAQARAALAAAAERGYVMVPKEPTEEMWMAARDPIMVFEDRSIGPKWTVGDHMDAGGYKDWATAEDRRKTNVTKGDCAVFVYRAMIAAGRVG